MKSRFLLSFLFFFSFSGYAFAQNIPVPAESVPANANSNSAKSMDDQMIEFFEGLNQAIEAQDDRCEDVVETLKKYCQTHREWINSLDYATVNVNEQTSNRIHEMAIQLGKRLSECFDERSASAIPALLDYCANK